MACECSDVERRAEKPRPKPKWAILFFIIFSLAMSSIGGSVVLVLFYKSTFPDIIVAQAQPSLIPRQLPQPLVTKRAPTDDNGVPTIEDRPVSDEDLIRDQSLGKAFLASVLGASKAVPTSPPEPGKEVFEQQQEHQGEQQIGQEGSTEKVSSPDPDTSDSKLQSPSSATATPSPIGGLPGNIVKDFENKEKTADRSGKPAIKTADDATGIPLSSLTATAARPQFAKSTALITVTRAPSVQARGVASAHTWSTEKVHTATSEGRWKAFVKQHRQGSSIPIGRPLPSRALNASPPLFAVISTRSAVSAVATATAPSGRDNGQPPTNPKKGPKHGGEGHGGIID